MENVDVGILGCGQALTCRDDINSSTGARCVAFEELDNGGSSYISKPCGSNSDCDVGYKCCMRRATFEYNCVQTPTRQMGFCK